MTHKWFASSGRKIILYMDVTFERSGTLNACYCADEYVQNRSFDTDERGFPSLTMLPVCYKKSEQKCQSLFFSALYRQRSYDVSFHFPFHLGYSWGWWPKELLFFFFLFSNSLSQAPMSQIMTISDQNRTTIQSGSQLEWSPVIALSVSGPVEGTAAVSFSFLHHFILLVQLPPWKTLWFFCAFYLLSFAFSQLF